MITLPFQDKAEEDILEIILDQGADDLAKEEDFYEIQTSMESFENVRKALIDNNLSVENASLQWIAKNTIPVSGDDSEAVIKLLEGLEDLDDVQNVFTNADFDEDSLK